MEKRFFFKKDKFVLKSKNINGVIKDVIEAKVYIQYFYDNPETSGMTAELKSSIIQFAKQAGVSIEFDLIN